jgi:nucleoid-associated protein YgaU
VAGCRHRVQRRDTLWGIASKAVARSDPQTVDRFVDRLYEANRQTISDPDIIFPGQVIRIPGCET